MSNIRFLDNAGVSAFGNIEGKNSLITASASGNNISFKKGDNSEFTISVTGGSETFNTSSLLTTGSVANNVITLTKGDGTTFTLTVNTGSSGDPISAGTISSSAQITDLGFVQSAITASSLETASANLNEITFTKGDGSTFILTVNTGSGTSIDTGSFITNAQTSSMSVGTASIANFIPFNGNRAVSNQNQPSGIKNVNFNANGLASFIEKVYFTNTAPTIISSNFTIGEFVVSGSTVGTVLANDPESGSQTVTFSTSSTYTADQFRINGSTGIITLNLKSTSSMNTFGSGSPAVDVAPFPIIATDSFSATGSKTIFIRVTPNTAPIWSTIQDGSLTTSATASLSESSAQANDKDRYFFRDSESDTITIGSGSFSSNFINAFRLVKTTNYVRLDQITSSLNIDTFPSYSFMLTASDEHYESGDDPTSIAYLPVRINVLDDLPPEIDPQDLGGVNENSTTGTVAGTVSATNPDQGTITFIGFSLKAANLDGGTNVTSSLGGTSLLNPSSDPFTINSGTGLVTRKAGQFLNSDIANRYIYTVTVKDNFNSVTNSADITIPIANHPASTVGDNWDNVYIIESARTGEFAKIGVNGFSGTTAQWSSAASQRWDIVSTPDFIGGSNATGSSTNLVLKSNLSGSATIGGNTIDLSLTASQDSFFTTKQKIDQIVNVVTMSAPDFTSSLQNNNLNTNGARPGNVLATASITDPQNYNINHSTFTFTPNAGQNLVAVRDGSSNKYFISASANLAAGTYGYTASIFNDRGFRTGSLQDTFSITQAPVGTLTENGTFRIIESATASAEIKISADGRTGTQGDLGVTYSPLFNGATVQSFTSSNAAIVVANNGNLSLGINLSGSSTGSGDTITSNITFRDQYDNIGSDNITVNVTLNQPPTATMNLGTNSLLTASFALSGSVIASLTGSDPQSFENIISASLSGISSSRFNLVDKTGASINRKYEIQPITSLEAGFYPITSSVLDAFGKSGSTNLKINIAVKPNIPEVYIYSSTFGAGAPIPASYNNLLNDAAGPIQAWASGSLGNKGPISLGNPSSGVMTLIGSASAGLVGSNLNTLLSSTIGLVNPTENEAGNHLIYVVYPSGSDPRLSGVPTSVTDAFGGSTVGEYVFYYFTDAIDKGIVGSQLDNFNLITGYTASNGTVKTDFNKWTVLGCNNSKFSSTATKFYVVPSSGSDPV
jgi:hypothetical protein